MRISITAAALSAALALSACSLKPHSPKAQDLSQVAVSFDPTILGALANEMKTLQVRIYGVNNSVVGAQEGADQSFAIVPQQQDYTIIGVHLGLKEFEVSILDAQSNALGVGRLRWLVKPGMNKTDALVIKIKSAQHQVASVSLDFAFTADGGVDPVPSIKKAVIQWKTQNSVLSGEIELVKGTSSTSSVLAFADVKGLVDDNCVSCHKGAHPQGKLDLSTFPFKSTHITDQAALLKAVVDRMNDADSPMPPDGSLEAPLLNKMKDWQTAGFLAVAPPAGSATDNDFRAKLENLKVSDKLLCTLIVTGENGVELYHQDLEPYVIADQAETLKLSVKLSVAAPTVSIPIVVQPQG